MNKNLYHLIMIGILLGCGGESVVSKDAHDAIGLDYKSDLYGVYDLYQYDATETVTFVPCTKDEDCAPLYICVDGQAGKVCAKGCVTEKCPDGWSCEEIVNPYGQHVLVCIPIEERLCRPCITNQDCMPKDKMTQDLCVEFGPQVGSFCGKDCSKNQTCPKGYKCTQVTIGMAEYHQCLPEFGGCICTQEFIEKGYETTCYVKGGKGMCKGKRKCTPEGLSDCDAPPPSEEVCDGVDNDCDGVTDPPQTSGCKIYFKDLDKDGYGTPETQCLCTKNEIYSAEKTDDCDDKDPNIHPDQMEICNGKDDNCDGKIDEENAKGCVTFYLDQDNDGIGVATQSKCLCKAQPPFSATVSGDCNDNDPNVKAGGEEVCNGKDDDCDGKTDEEGAKGCMLFYQDIDKDNAGNPNKHLCLCEPEGDYTAKEGSDCNDNDPNIHPQALEVCNGLDDNCDGIIDPDGSFLCANYYLDQDGDGVGDSSTAKCLCAPIAKYVPQGGDCNDLDPSVGAGKTEECNGKDDDCDGLVDEEGAIGCKDFLKDTDKDGYGVSNLKKCLCGAWQDYSTNVGGDCNDADPSMFPNAKEVCNNKDDDCDGIVDPEGVSGCKTYYLDEDSDGYGVLVSKCLCSPVGKFTATKSGDCNDANKNINPSAKEACNNGIDDNCDGKIDEGCQPTYRIGINPDDGANSGACGCICEDNVNLSIGLHLRDWLLADTNKTNGGGTWAVFMTRESAQENPSVAARAAYLNSKNLDRAISISGNAWGGCNCCANQAYGTETFKKTSGSPLDDYAVKVQSRAVSAFGSKDRGVKVGSYEILVQTSMPHVYLFIGFVTDSNDSNKMNNDSIRNNVANALLHAFQNHFGYGEFDP